MIRVALFDDNVHQRDALAALLSDTEGMQCTGAFAHARQAVEDLRTMVPDVVLMDIDMPGVDGVEATTALRGAYPELRVIILTVIEDDARILAAIRAGADGYFLKQTPPLRLMDGILEVMAGGAPMSPGVARRVIDLVAKKPDRKMDHGLDLTPRELEILGLLVKGWTYKRIAAELGISFGTVNKHVCSVYQKLRVGSVGEAVALAVRKGLV